MLTGPSCQSCGMPIKNPTDFGREKSGVIKVDYCRHCYDRGAFTDPDMTFEKMVDFVAQAMMESKKDMPVDVAQAGARDILSELRRWKDSVPQPSTETPRQ